MKLPSYFPFAVLAVLVIGLLLAGPLGCANSDPELRLTSLSHQQTWRQDFSHGYCRRDSTGNLDVVLVDQATSQALAGHPSSAPTRQVMHIRVLWTPARDQKAVASNAAIHWYVIGDNNPANLLEYSGTGFVSLDRQDDGSATVHIQNATLKPSSVHGNLTDPLGPTRLEGTVQARTDAQRVARVLNDLKLTLASANQARAAADEER